MLDELPPSLAPTLAEQTQARGALAVEELRVPAPSAEDAALINRVLEDRPHDCRVAHDLSAFSTRTVSISSRRASRSCFRSAVAGPCSVGSIHASSGGRSGWWRWWLLTCSCVRTMCLLPCCIGSQAVGSMAPSDQIPVPPVAFCRSAAETKGVALPRSTEGPWRPPPCSRCGNRPAGRWPAPRRGRTVRPRPEARPEKQT